MKFVVQVSGYLILLGGALLFGVLGRPAEMALAIAAGSLALAFSEIERFRRVKGAGFEAELWDQIEAIVEKETEIPPPEDGEEASPLYARVDGSTKAVMDALHRPEYTWRYLGGIKKDTGLESNKVVQTLKWLVENSYARHSQGKHGPIWSLTEEGRHLNAFSDFEDLTKT